MGSGHYTSKKIQQKYSESYVRPDFLELRRHVRKTHGGTSQRVGYHSRTVKFMDVTRCVYTYIHTYTH